MEVLQGKTSLQQAEQRIGWLIICLGVIAAASAASLVSLVAGAGVVGGAFLAWVNYLWLHSGVEAIARRVDPESGKPPQAVSRWVWFRFMGRFALMAVGAYVMIHFFSVPTWSVFVGLLALVAAAIVEGIIEVFVPVKSSNT